jgi:hypothetical protein
MNLEHKIDTLLIHEEWGSVTLSSNYNNKFALDISPNFSIFDQEGHAYGFILHLDIALMTN